MSNTDKRLSAKKIALCRKKIIQKKKKTIILQIDNHQFKNIFRILFRHKRREFSALDNFSKQHHTHHSYHSFILFFNHSPI